MTRTVGTIAVLLALSVSVPGCGLLDFIRGLPPAEVTLTEADSGRMIDLTPGQNLVITLVANPSTGYTWEATALNQNLLQQVGQPAFTSDNPGLAGAPGHMTFRFKAVHIGQTTLTLIYHRSFEPGVPPSKTFSVTVIIR